MEPIDLSERRKASRTQIATTIAIFVTWLLELPDAERQVAIEILEALLHGAGGTE